MKLLKHLLIAIAVLLVVVVAAGAAAFFLIPADKLAALASEEVRKATGRELTIAGGVSPSLYPVLGATVSQAALSNAEWGADDNLITVGEAKVGVRMAPLLAGRIEIEEIRLTDAAIALEVAPDGRPNWAFEGSDDAGHANAGDHRGRAGEAGEGLERLGRVHLVLENAAITYDNRATGASFATRELSLAATLEDPDQPLQVEGAGVFNDQNVRLSLNLATPAKLVGGETALADLSVGFGGAELSYSGSIEASERGDAPSAKGAISASVPDIPALLAALGAAPLDAPEGALQSAAMDGQLAFDGPTAELSGLALTLDGQTISGEASIDASGARPMITAALMADDLDLSPYMRGEQGGSGGGSDGGSGGGEGWSEEPIDLSGLRTVDADISIQAHSVLLDKGRIRDADIRMRLRNGALTLTINKLQMFDGGATGAIRLDGSGAPSLGADLSIDSVRLLTLLATLADFDRLEGVGAASVNVTGSGDSLHAIMNSLDGAGSVKLTDGAILGLNLAAMVRNATGAFLGGGGESQKTDFSEISASFAIKDGVATNTDLIFLGPLLRASGAGTIDIGGRALNYRLTPRAVASLEGQGGDAGIGGVAAPVLITGPWSKPNYAPDLAGAISGIVTDPAGLTGTALGAAKNPEDLVGGAIGGLLGEGSTSGDGSTGTTTEETPKSDPIDDALKGLLGR